MQCPNCGSMGDCACRHAENIIEKKYRSGSQNEQCPNCGSMNDCMCRHASAILDGLTIKS